MKYQLDITLSDEDYLQFNYFQQFQTKQGKKLILILRLLVTIIIALTTISGIFAYDWPFYLIFIALLAVFCAVYHLFLLKRTLKTILKKHIMKLKNSGKLPYDSVSRLEFHKDKIVEITDSSRIEKNYVAVERVCVVDDQYIYVYTSAVSAYILPISQLKEQVNQAEFLDFLSQKCPCVEYCKA